MRLGVVTDAHIAPVDQSPAGFHNPFEFANARANLQLGVDNVASRDVDAIVYLGDLANGGDAASHAEGLHMLMAPGLPVWAVPGNHDCDEGAGVFRDRVAALPPGAVTIPTPDGERCGAVWTAGLSIVSITPAREWELEQPAIDSWPDELVVLLTHFPPISLERAAIGAGLRYAGDVLGHERIAAAVAARHGPVVVLHGHHHLRETATTGGVLQIGFASLIEAPHEVGIVDIETRADEVVVSVEHIPVAESTVNRLPVLAPRSATWRYRGGAWH